METINTFEQLEKIALEIRGLANWWDYQKEIDALRDSYLAVAFDKTDRELRWRQCSVAHVCNRDFYLCDAKGFEEARRITRKEIARQMARNEEIKRKLRGEEEKEALEEKRAKTPLALVSPNSFNYLVPEMPRFTARQDALIDFMFSKIHKDIPKATKKELSLITQNNYEMVLADREEYPVALTGFKFPTTEVRKSLGIRYPEKEMFEDFKIISDTGIDAHSEKIWADEKGKYRKEADWRGHIITDVVRTRTTKLVPRTGEPIHEIHILLGYITGMLWINDSVREKYRLFSKDFYKLPHQCQKIYRYLSLWKESHIHLDKFIDILGYKEAKNLTDQKNKIEAYLDILKKEEFILSWERIEGTRGLKTQWYILKESPE